MRSGRFFSSAGAATKADRRTAAVLLLSLMLCLGIIFWQQSTFVLDADALHDHQRSLFKYYRIADPGLFVGDYVTYFTSAFPQPYLYEGINYAWVWAGGELTLLHRLLVLANWLAFLAALAVAARSLGDRLTILGALAFGIAQPIYLYQIGAASAHSFAFPLVGWGVVCLVRDWTRGLALVTLLSGLLYTAVTPLLGLCLAWQVFIAQDFLRSPLPDRRKAVLLVAAVAALSLFLVYGSLRQPEGLGEPLTPLQQMELYPETGLEGMYASNVSEPLRYVFGRALSEYQLPAPLAFLVLLALAGASVYGFLMMPKDSVGRRGLTGIIICSLLTVLLIYLWKPYYTYRFVLYPLFALMPLLPVIGLQTLAGRLAHVVRLPAVLAVLVLAPIVLSLDSLSAKQLGFLARLEADDHQVLAFAAAQPPETLFADWPDAVRSPHFIPYLARRALFVMIRAHFPTHDKHVLEMRARMNDLIDAYLATDEAPLRALACRWGVDYLIVEKAHFTEDGEQPAYFAPFDARIDEILRAHRREELLLARPDPAMIALQNETYVVLRLPQQGGGACAGGQGAIEAAGEDR